ncbi:MAG: tetratricopeptide repeat protein [Phycisphaerae bacterium]
MGASWRHGRKACDRHICCAVVTVVGLAAVLPAWAQTATRQASVASAGTQLATGPGTRPAGATTTRPGADTAEGLVELGRRAEELKKYDEALGYYRLAYEKDPKSVAALAGTAGIFLKQNKLAESIRVYLSAAQVAIGMNQYATAEQLLQQAAGIDPSDSRVAFLLARVYEGTRREAQAIEMYRRYIKTERNDYRAYLGLGRLYLAGSLYRQAIAALKQADTLNPQDAETLITLAKAYHAVKDYEQARSVAARPIEMLEQMFTTSEGLKNVPSGFADQISTYATILLDNGNVDQAEQHIRLGLEAAREKLRQTPDDLTLLRGMVQLCQTSDAVLRARLSKQPRDPKLLASRARLVGELADLNQAIELHRAVGAWAEAAQAAPDDTSILQELATAQYRVKKLWDAAETCRKILALKPDDSFARTLLQQIGPVTSQPVSTTQPRTIP